MFGKKKDATPEGSLKVDGYMGSVLFDGETITISKTARGATRIPVQQIASVAIEPAGLGMKGIRFLTSASSTGRVKALGSHKDLASDPQTLTFRSGRLGEFETLAQRVEAAIHDTGAPRSPEVRDVTAKLADLAQMHRDGTLTDEEFSSAKNKLLGQ